MSTQVLHPIAQADSPPEIQIPASPYGILVWAITKLGFGAVFAYALWIVYGDLKATNERLMVSLEKRAVTDADMARALTELTSAIKDIANESRAAHRITSK